MSKYNVSKERRTATKNWQVLMKNLGKIQEKLYGGWHKVISYFPKSFEFN